MTKKVKKRVPKKKPKLEDKMVRVIYTNAQKERK